MVERRRRGEDEQVGVAPLPERRDDRGHEAQHPAGALEAVEAAPVVHQPIEELRVDGVGALHPAAVVGLAAALRELAAALPVHGDEGADHRVAGDEVGLRRDGLEQPPPDDLEPLLRARRQPRRLHPPEGVLQTLQRLLPAFAPDLDLRRREARHHHRLRRGAGRLGERLHEGQVRVEGPGGEAVVPVQLAEERHPLVHQHDAGRVAGEQRRQHPRTGAHPAPVRTGDHPVALGPPELPRQLAPERAGDGPVVLPVRLARRELRPHQHRAAARRRAADPGFRQQRIHPRQPVRFRRAEQVVEREHRVRLAAAEVRLQLDHRVAAGSREPPHRAFQQPLQPLGQEGPPEELHRIAVFRTGGAGVDRREVGGELRLLEVAGGHILVGLDHLPPGAEPGLRLRLRRHRALLDPVAGALLEHRPHLFLPHPVHRRRVARRADRGQEQPRGVQRAQRPVAVEVLFVGVVVADLDELAHPRPPGTPERVLERRLPVVRHCPQQRVAVPPHRAVRRAIQRELPLPDEALRPLPPVPGAQVPLDEGGQALAQRVQRAADAVAVGCGHGERAGYPYSAAPRVPAGKRQGDGGLPVGAFLRLRGGRRIRRGGAGVPRFR